MKRVHFFLAIFALTAFSACNNQHYIETDGYELHTPYHIKYQHTKPLDKEIKDILQVYYHSINAFDSSSIISKVNRNIPVELDTIFVTIYNKAHEVSVATDGLFDVTCAPLINLWGFGFKQGIAITPENIANAKKIVGYNKVRIENNKFIKDTCDILVNFSALGDGYSCDLVSSLFEKYNIENYCIEIGGEIVTKGKNPKGEDWKIGIIEPKNGCTINDEEINRIVALNGKKGLATSGDYRNYKEYKGKKISHEINPKTGYPAESDIISATVIASDGITADAYATAFMVMGSNGVATLMKGRDDMSYFLICKGPDSTIITKASDNF